VLPDVVVQVGGEPTPACDVVVADERERAAVVRTVAAAPLAARVLVQVLRTTEALPVEDALVVESLAYSALLAGPEFAAWLARRGPADRPPVGDDPVGLARDGDVLTITLQRPDRHNAYAAAVRDALVDALEVGLADPDLRVRLRGAGRSFCSGGDLDEFGTTPDVVTAHAIRTARSAGLRLHRQRERATVEVHGACVGAGVELAAFAGTVETYGWAYFQLPELRMGLIPGAGGTVSLPRRIGRHRTAWLALTGRRLDVATALDWGLVDRAC
jgi:hypothetical protein